MYPFILKKKATQAGPNPATIISAASLHFDFRERSLTEKVSNTSPLTLSRPYQKYAVNSSGRYSVTAAGSAVYSHSATGVCRGILIEGISKNYQLYSNTFAGTPTGWDGWPGTNAQPPGVTGSQGVGGGGRQVNVSVTAGQPGPIDGLENTPGYQSTKVEPTATLGVHSISKYGSTVQDSGFNQFVIALKLSGNTADYAIRITCIGDNPYFTLNSQGQVLESNLNQSQTPAFNQNSIFYPVVNTTSDGWMIVSWVADSYSGSGNNFYMPQLVFLKKNGNTYEQSFAGAGDVSLSLFGFSREFANSRSFYGAERLFSSYIHSNSGSTTTRAADSLLYNALSANVRSLLVEAYGPVYDCSLLSIDDGTASSYNPGGVNTYAYEPNNMIDLRADASIPSPGVKRSTYIVCIRRSVSVTINTTTGVITASAAHNLTAGMVVEFRNMASPYDLPAPLNLRQTYYVLAAGLTSTTFSISDTANGAAISFTGTATGTYVARIQSSFQAGVPATDGTQRFIVSWDDTNVLCVATGGGVTLTPHGLGAAPVVSTMRFGTGFRINRLADLNQPIARTIGWNRMLTQAEALALLRQP